MQALAVNGYGTGELLRVDKSTVANAGINNNPLSLSQYTEFWSLVNKSSSSYLPVTGDVGIVGGNNKINNLLGQALPAGPATNGQVLVSNGTSWTLQSMSGGGGSVGSVSGTSPISVGGPASAPVISLPAASNSVDGYLTSADWNSFNSKQSILNATTNSALRLRSTTGNSVSQLRLSSSPSAAGNLFGQIGFYDSGSAEKNMANIKAIRMNNNGDAGLSFETGVVNSLAEAMRIDQNGNVGIGTTAPGSSLDIKGTLRLSGSTSGYVGFAPAATAGSTTYTMPSTQGTAGQVLSTDGVAGTPTLSWISPLTSSTGFLNGGNSFGGNSSIGNNDNFNLDLKTNNTSRLTIKNDGKIGIGTTNPIYPLQINALTGSASLYTLGNIESGGNVIFSSQVNPYIYNSTGLSNTALTIGGSNAQTGGYLELASTVSVGSSPTGDYIKFTTNNTNTEAMRIVHSGAVGIGTTTPSDLLDVNGNINTNGYFRVNSNAFAALTTNNILIGDSIGNGNAISLWTNGNSRMFLSTTGNVGIGTTTPDQLLELSGGILKAHSATNAVYLQSNDNYVRINSENSGPGGTGADIAILHSNGNVGIGTTAPSEVLEVSGNVKATSFISTSDRRLKKDIHPIEGLELIRQLNGYRYNWKANNKSDTGVIAQEVEAVLPDAVVTDAQSGYKAVKYQNLIAPLIESTKELYGMCTAQEREIASLKAENAELKKRLDLIEKKLGMQQ